jgi:hypothetical protein
MVLYYGLFALETANNMIAAEAIQRESLTRKSQTISSSSNSWIYTKDLKRHFEERYGDYHYIFVPVYIDGKTVRYYSNSIAMIPQKSAGEHSWIYSRSLRNHLFNSGSVCNQDEISRKKKSIFHRRKYRSNDVEEEENENHSIPVIKHR